MKDAKTLLLDVLDAHVLIETPDHVFTEYSAHTTATATGRLIHHLFAARLVANASRARSNRRAPAVRRS